MLNHDLSLITQPAAVQRAFAGNVRRQLLYSGHELYKYTEYSVFKPDGSVSPWWSSVEPIDADDPGFSQSMERSSRLGVTPARFARVRTAVTEQWNRMSNLTRIRLKVPTYALVGRCAHQPIDNDPSYSNVVFIGGGWQIYLPNLTAGHISVMT